MKFGLFNEVLASSADFYEKRVTDFLHSQIFPALHKRCCRIWNSNNAGKEEKHLVCSNTFLVDLALKADNSFSLVDIELLQMDYQWKKEFVFFHSDEFRNGGIEEETESNINLDEPLKQTGHMRYLAQKCDLASQIYPMNNVPLDFSLNPSIM